MSAAADDRARDPLGAAFRLLEAGRSRDAADAFGRLLLQDPASAPAQLGLERASAALAEEARLLESALEDARAAALAGDHGRALPLLEDVIRRGGDRDRAAALLERLEQRAGRLDVGAAPRARAGEEPPPPLQPRGWSRRVFVACWVAAFALLATGLAWSWERLLAGLVATPAPHARSSVGGGH